MSKIIKPICFVICCIALNIFSTYSASADISDGEDDVVCTAVLPCSPPAFEVFEEFKTGPCANLYKISCAKWKEIKYKADALDMAVQKLVQCQQDKKLPEKPKKKNKK